MEDKNMSTRSRIGILNANGSTDTVYCHSDGYPEYQMPILMEHYNTVEKVEDLLDLGDLSILKERIAPAEGEPHGFDYDDRAENVTVAYHRDRGEPLTPAQHHRSIADLKASDWSIEYFYLFDAEKGAWLPPIKG
jgi:hypothetical protein